MVALALATAISSLSNPNMVLRISRFCSSTKVMNTSVTKATVYWMPLITLRNVRPPLERPKSPLSTRAGANEVAYQLGYSPARIPAAMVMTLTVTMIPML